MAAIPKGEQGFERGLDKFQRGTRNDPIYFAPRLSLEQMRAADRLEAAIALGKIFKQVRPEHSRLDDWALPTNRNDMGERYLPYQLDAPTEIVLGANQTLQARMRMYDRYFEAVMPDVGKSALAWGLRTLTQQLGKLRQLRIEIPDDQFAEWMHRAAKEIMRRAADCFEKTLAADRRARLKKDGFIVDEPRFTSPFKLHKRVQELMRRFDHCRVSAVKSFVSSPMVDASVATYLQPQLPFATQVKYMQQLQVLLAHSKMPVILQAYYDSAAAGTAKATALLLECDEAINDFRASLAGSPRSVWRYPSLIVGGLQELRLDDLTSFKEFALAAGAIEARKTPEVLLNYIGLGLFAVALLSGFGIGLAFLDVAISGAGTAFAFVRERQQDNAVKASLLLPDSAKYATEGGYGDTALGLAFTLVAAISFVQVFKAARASKVAAASEAVSPHAPKSEPKGTKGTAINDAARGKDNPATVRPASAKPAEPTTSAKPKEASVGNNATHAAPSKPKPLDEFADLKLATDEAPRIANPRPDQVEDAIKAFKKQMRRWQVEGLEVREFKDFYLTPKQGQTFARLSDAILTSASRAIPEGLSASRAALLTEAELAAENLRRRIQAHWDAALPKRGKQTAQQAALEWLQELTKTPPTEGTVNEALREKLFNNWRKRFLRRVAKDEKLILDLEVQAGVVFGSEEAPSSFAVLVRDDAGRLSWVGLDLDHAVIRHEDAVARAFATGDASLLTSTVNSANLQLMTARENRHVIEKLRELDRLYWSVKAGPTPQAIQPFK